MTDKTDEIHAKIKQGDCEPVDVIISRINSKKMIEPIDGIVAPVDGDRKLPKIELSGLHVDSASEAINKINKMEEAESNNKKTSLSDAQIAEIITERLSHKK